MRLPRLLTLVVLTACGAPSTAYRAQWCATYCSGSTPVSICATECPLSDAGQIEDAGFDAGGIDAGVDGGMRARFDSGVQNHSDAGARDAGFSDSGIGDAGSAVSRGGLRLVSGDGGLLTISAGACNSVKFTVFDSSGAPHSSTGSLTVTQLTGVAQFYDSTNTTCSGLPGVGGVTSPFSGSFARLTLRSETYGPQTFLASTDTGESSTFEVDFTARLVVHAPISDGGCRSATASFTSADSDWLPVYPPPGAGSFHFSSDGGTVQIHDDESCASNPVPSIPIPTGGAISFGISGDAAMGAELTIGVDSAFLAATELNFSANGVALELGRPGDDCAAGCFTDGCIQESRPVCECAVTGSSCRDAEPVLTCCHSTVTPVCMNSRMVCD